MTGLVIKLKPNEKILINGVVLQNGDRASRLRVRSDNVSILRARDAIPPEAADTPLKRIYNIAQLALAGEADTEEASKQIKTAVEDMRGIFAGEAQLELDRALDGALEQKFYVVMRAVKKLFALEHALLSQATKAS